MIEKEITVKVKTNFDEKSGNVVVNITYTKPEEQKEDAAFFEVACDTLVAQKASELRLTESERELFGMEKITSFLKTMLSNSIAKLRGIQGKDVKEVSMQAKP
jgi:hypothetical protein